MKMMIEIATDETLTQQQRDVLTFMWDTGSITPLDAFREFGITRLAARIYELKKRGYPIEKEMEMSLNRYGTEVHYARYKFAA